MSERHQVKNDGKNWRRSAWERKGATVFTGYLEPCPGTKRNAEFYFASISREKIGFGAMSIHYRETFKKNILTVG